MNKKARGEELLETIQRFSKKLPKFPDGRIDYTDSKISPVIIVFVRHKNKILALKRSNKVLAYKGMWSTVAGFLDEVKPIEEKVKEELKEELNINERNILSISIGEPYKFNDKEIDKIWLRYPILVDVRERPAIRLDEEHSDYKWVTKKGFSKLSSIPGTEITLEYVFQ